MESNRRCVDYLESSFLAPILEIEGVTDISFNGESLFYQDNLRGRKKANFAVKPNDVGDFLRQIANFSEKQFSYLNPVLDVTFGRYRLNACFLSVVRVRDEKSYSFALRIGREGSAVSEDPSFFPGKSKPILLSCLDRGDSIVIGGDTGSGKTELQKYLLMSMRPATRVIVIDNVEELELSRNSSDLDLTTWLVDSKNTQSSFSGLIRNALRNNPDYIVVAEARGPEMMEGIHCAMSGHPLILTLHAFSLEQMPSRVGRLAMQSGPNLVYEEIMEDVRDCFQTFVFLEKKMERSGRVQRFISKIGRMELGKKEMTILYQKEEKA